MSARGAGDADQDLRSQLLQVARHREQHRRRRLEQRVGQVLDALAHVRHQLGDQRQRHGDVAAEHMAQRQIGDRAVRLGVERRILRRDRACRGQMLAVADQRALGMARGARGIDDEGRLLRLHLGHPRLEPSEVRIAAALAHLAEGGELVVREREQRRLVDHDDVAQRRQPIRQRQDLVDVLLVLGDEHHRAAVAHLVLDLLGRGGRIDAVHDRAERLRGKVGDQPFLAGIRHDGDAITGRHAQRRQAFGRARDQQGVFAPSPLAIEPSFLARNAGASGRALAPARAAAAGAVVRRRSARERSGSRRLTHGTATRR